MQRVRPVRKEIRCRLAVWKMDEVVRGAERRVPLALSPGPKHHGLRPLVAVRQEVSQRQLERSGLGRCDVVGYVWEAAGDELVAEVGEVGGGAGRWKEGGWEETASLGWVEGRSAAEADSDDH